jgi:F-box/WD-40 domain protein 7
MTFNPKQGKIYSMICDRNKLFAASSDYNIHIYCVDTMKKVGILTGHTGGVNSIKIWNDQLISASTDKSIKIWDLNTQSCTKTIAHHPSEVNFMNSCRF